MSSTARLASASFCASRARSTTFVLAHVGYGAQERFLHKIIRTIDLAAE
jgi:hypothetical protein